MARSFSIALALVAAVHASSISEYYYSDCGSPVNVYLSGSTPTYCNTQQGASIGYTLDSACSFYIYDGLNCEGSPVVSVGWSAAECVDFPGTGASWLFVC